MIDGTIMVGVPERVSVIIPCFNAANYVGEAIESVLAQTRPCDELIVVDDGSTDASAHIVADFGTSIRYIYQENQGISAARNCGVAMAQGSCFAFLDADDLWPSDSLALRLHCLTENSALHYTYGWVEPFISPDVPDGVRAAIRNPGDIQAGRLAGSLLVRREVFDAIGLFDGRFRIGETMDWVARVDAAGYRAGEVAQVVLRRRVHGGNTVLKERQMQGDYLRVLRAAINRRQKAAGR